MPHYTLGRRRRAVPTSIGAQGKRVLDDRTSAETSLVEHVRPAEELDFDCEHVVKACLTTNVELILNLASDSDDDDWGDCRTVFSDSDDSSDDSDQVNYVQPQRELQRLR